MSEPGSRFLHPVLAVLAVGMAAGILHRVIAVPLLGLAGAAVGLGLAPGYALAGWLAPGEREWVRVCRGLFLSPLVTGAAGVGFLAAGLTPGTAAVLVAGVSLAAAILVALRAPRVRPPRWERRLLVWLLVLAALVLVPHALREWVRYRSDAWFHTAVAYEIMARGIPPDDPYFAGIPLNYPWFFHVIVVLWTSLAGARPWDTGGLLDAGWLISLTGGVFVLSRRLGRPGREAFFASLFVPLGLAAGFWLWLPIKVAKGLFGETAGPEHLANLLRLSPFTFDTVGSFISTFGSRLPVLDKYLVMSAFGGALTAGVWSVEGFVALLRSHASGRRLAGLAVAVFGLWALHPTAGLAVIPALAAAGAALLVRPGPPVRRILLVALGVILGSAPGLGFLLLSAGRAEGVWPFGFEPRSALSILVGATIALPLGVAGLWRLRPGPGSRLARLLTVALCASSLVVVLPPPNTEDKLSFFFYLMPAVAAGWFLGRMWFVSRRRGRVRWFVAGWTAAVAPVSLLYLAALFVTPPHRTVPPDDLPLYAWLQAATPGDAVILDTAERDDVLVRVPRRQYWGREPYARQWGYPADRIGTRRLVRDVFVPRGPARAEPDAPDLRQALTNLDAFTASESVPVYLIWRPADHGGTPGEESPAGRLPDRFERVWAGASAEVYRFLPSAAGS